MLRSPLYTDTTKCVKDYSLIDCTLNSILNSPYMVQKIYDLSPSNISLSNSFSKITNGIYYAYSGFIYKYLLSAFMHDYVNMKNRGFDVRKFLFMNLLHDKETSIEMRKLDNEFSKFIVPNHFRSNAFIPYIDNLAEFHYLNMTDVILLHKTLQWYLSSNDAYFIYDFNCKDVSSIDESYLNASRRMLMAALTSTSRYVCTDITFYKYNDTDLGYGEHAVTYNVLEQTMIDDHVKVACDINYLTIPPKCNSYAQYVEMTGKRNLYLPFALHYIKIDNNARTLGLVGNSLEYTLRHNERLRFIERNINVMYEDWFKGRVEEHNTFLKFLVR